MYIKKTTKSPNFQVFSQFKLGETIHHFPLKVFRVNKTPLVNLE